MKGPFRIKNVNKRFRFTGKKKHRMKCAKCRKECSVPFVPKMNRPVYCKSCFIRIRKEKKKAKLN